MSARLFRFLVSGGSAAAVEYAAFVALHWLLGAAWLFASQSLSFFCGFVVSFLLNRGWVFRSSGAFSGELLKYGLVAAVNLVAGNLAIGLLVGPLQVNHYLAKLVVMVVIAAWNYLIFSQLVFRQRIDKNK